MSIDCCISTLKVVERVPSLVAVLKNEQTESSQSTLSALAELMYTLIYQHSGFPELYEPVLDALQVCQISVPKI